MRRRILAVGALTAVVAGTLVYAHHHKRQPVPSTPPVVSSACVTDGIHPDPKCTPGTTNPNVTQANIHQTICVTGWTATVRPPQSYTEPLKVQSIKAYGYKDTSLAHYEEDHFVPLELGGSPTDVQNLWAEPGASPNLKDSVEGQLRAKVCSGKLTLQDAQSRIIIDWTTALK